VQSKPPMPSLKRALSGGSIPPPNNVLVRQNSGSRMMYIFIFH
jgi:hypothetical protein